MIYSGSAVSLTLYCPIYHGTKLLHCVTVCDLSPCGAAAVVCQHDLIRSHCSYQHCRPALLQNVTMIQPSNIVLLVLYALHLLHVLRVLHSLHVLHVLGVLHVLHVLRVLYILHVLRVLHVLHVLHILKVLHILRIPPVLLAFLGSENVLTCNPPKTCICLTS